MAYGRWFNVSLRISLVAALASGVLAARPADAAIAVFANQATRAAEFAIVGADGQTTSRTLEAGRVVAVPVDEASALEFGGGDARRQFDLAPNAAYFFYEVERGGKLEFSQIGFTADDQEADADAPPDESENGGPRAVRGKAAAAGRPERRPLKKPPRLHDRRIFKIPVKLLVDDDHPGTQQFWERQLRNRLAAASEIFEQHGCAGFEVVAVGTWRSDDAIRDLEMSYQEFEKTVRPAPARLAIGFTCQHPLPQARTDLGTARRPLRSHLLLCESSGNVSEVERCELLVHELGHYLGAVHSPEPDSVMRVVLGDGHAHSRGRRLRFDPLNALAIGMVSQELANRSITSLDDASPPVRQRLTEIYDTLARAIPQDNVTAQSLSWLRNAPGAGQPGLAPAVDPDSLRSAAQRVVQAVVAEASSLTAADTDGEKLTERYVRAAATAAAELPDAVRVQAVFLGLAIAIDRSEALRKYPVMGDFVRQIETDEQRRARLAVLRQPTMRGRIDLGQHFFFSSAIMAMAGEKSAEAAGLAKELHDARGGSGFSFSDWCADLSGVALARRVQAGEVALEDLAGRFTVAAYLPAVNGLKDNLTQAQFTRLYGGVSDQRFQSVDADIRGRIKRLYAPQK